VKRSARNALGPFVEKHSRTAHHFPGRLARKREQEDRFGTHSLFYEPGHPVYQCSRFTRACAGDDQRRSFPMRHRIILPGIEFLPVRNLEAGFIGSDERKAAFLQSDFLHD